MAVDNVSKLGFWEANMDAVAVDGTDAGLQGRTAILDTGLVPQSFVKVTSAH